MVAALVLGATIAAPAAAKSPEDNHSDRSLTVMTRNLDAGTDFGYIFNAPTVPDLLAGAAKTYTEVLASNPAARAARVADEIATSKPDLVALQEVSVWRTGPLGGPAATKTIDQLQLLLDALAARHLGYSAAVVVPNLDAEIPTALGIDVRFTDNDAILVRTDESPGHLRVSNPQSGHFANFLTVLTVVGNVAVPRSWESVDVTARGRSARFIGTHLEAFGVAVQAAQAHEIFTGPANTRIPVILAGDMNSGPGPTTGAYSTLIADGFSDTWTATHEAPGFTWPLFLEDPTVPFPAGPFQRIDMVLTRGDVVPEEDSRVGLSPSRSGLFGSDHVGVVSELRVSSR
jgi:endonuclease/exonuclease/phosphatase family metal-dependent hydrolase